jgi:hypothetical protein
MDRGGRIRFRLTGVAGRTYRIEASTNLMDWVPLGTCRPGQDGDCEIPASNARTYPFRFYRLTEPQSP